MPKSDFITVRGHDTCGYAVDQQMLDSKLIDLKFYRPTGSRRIEFSADTDSKSEEGTLYLSWPAGHDTEAEVMERAGVMLVALAKHMCGTEDLCIGGRSAEENKTEAA